jgi:hypothetical protein
MAPFDIPYDIIPTRFKIGDLVRFTGYHYSPEYYHMDDREGSLGIIVEELPTVGLRGSWLYRVYWFKTHKTAETISSHITMVEGKKKTNY